MKDVRLAKALGLFSLVLGFTELFAARRVAGALGLGSPGLVRAFGAREVAAGFGVLTRPDVSAPVWSRVAGDALDLGVLAMALARPNPKRSNVAWATLAVIGATALDVTCAVAMDRRRAGALQTARRTRVTGPAA